MSFVGPGAKILDFGCANGWVGTWAVERGWTDIVGVDLEPPADIVGDIQDWKNLGLQEHSFDVIVAFEVLEHGDFAVVLRELLKPEGLLLATTPVPKWDWLCRLMERVGVLQARTGPHVNLLDLRTLPGFQVVDFRVKGLVAQWGVLKPA